MSPPHPQPTALRRDNHEALEAAANEWLAADTARRGSGITRYPPRPAGEQQMWCPDWWGNDHMELATYDTYEHDDDDTALARLADRLLDDLPALQRQAVELVAVRGLTFQLAANIAGVSKGTVHWRYEKGVVRMREAIVGSPWASALVGAWLVTPADTLGDSAVNENAAPHVSEGRRECHDTTGLRSMFSRRVSRPTHCPVSGTKYHQLTLW